MTLSVAVGSEKRTASRAGCSMPVRARYAAYSGSSTTTVSGRFSNARIIAVEMLRGPDHMATRTASLTATRARRRSWPGARRGVGLHELAVQPLQALDHRPAPSLADRAAVDRPDGHDARERAGHEGLSRTVDIGEAERGLPRHDVVGGAQLEHVGPGDPGQAVAPVGRQHLGRLGGAGDDEEVG